MGQSPRATAIVPVINTSLGYSFPNLAVPSSRRIGLNGLDAALTIDIIPRLGARLDLGYINSINIVNPEYQAYVNTVIVLNASI